MPCARQGGGRTGASSTPACWWTVRRLSELSRAIAYCRASGAAPALRAGVPHVNAVSIAAVDGWCWSKRPARAGAMRHSSARSTAGWAGAHPATGLKPRTPTLGLPSDAASAPVRARMHPTTHTDKAEQTPARVRAAIRWRAERSAPDMVPTAGGRRSCRDRERRALMPTRTRAVGRSRPHLGVWRSTRRRARASSRTCQARRGRCVRDHSSAGIAIRRRYSPDRRRVLDSSTW